MTTEETETSFQGQYDADRISESLPPNLAFLAPVDVDGLIRVGNEHDGGYVVPEDTVQEVDAVLSFGVSTDWSFEEHFKQLNSKVEIHAYDHTVGEQRFLRAYQRGIIKWLLRRTSLSDVRRRRRILRSYRIFFPSQAIHFEEAIHARNSTPGHATIDKVFRRTKSHRIFLKIDIAGSEYSIIDDILRYADRIKALVIEFHETIALRDTFCSAVKRLQREFQIVHVHGNNFSQAASDGLPNVMEITFVHGAAPSSARRRRSLPLASLDSPNDPKSPDHPLRFNQA
jgi:hypothetical protein